MREILYAEEAHVRIAKLPPSIRQRLQAVIERLAEHPELGKTLTGHLQGVGFYRTGDYRILYRWECQRNALLIMTVGHRKDIYRVR
jgi:mRNA-degrading endonuclease RelE of RelBE toxin-antitoxin system